MKLSEIYVFFYYIGAVIVPFFIFSWISSAYQGAGRPARSLTVMVSLYVGKFPLLICLYHLLLSVMLAAFCAQEVTQNMAVAVDLNYYTKTSIRATEAYDAIQDGKYQKSYYTYFFHGAGNKRRLEGGPKDLVAIYHQSNWNNVLTYDGIIDICLAENKFLSSQACMGSEVSSLIQTLMTESCEYKRSFEETRLAFGLNENAIYVQDNINANNPKSVVVLSYYGTSCNLQLESVDKSVHAVESSVPSTSVAYAHSDLVTDAFVAAGINDVRLSLLAMIVCYGVLSLSVGLKFLYGLLFMLCIVLSLLVAAGCLPLFGFSYFSAFNVLAIFVITGVGADAIIVFCSAWYKCLKKTRMVAMANRLSSNAQDGLDDIDMVPLFPLVLYSSYSSVVSALAFTVMTTILSFMANLVSPIVVIAQLGAFMGTAMIMYFSLLHLIMIPAWVFVANMDQCVSLCAPCLESMSRLRRTCGQSAGPATLVSQRVSNGVLRNDSRQSLGETPSEGSLVTGMERDDRDAQWTVLGAEEGGDQVEQVEVRAGAGAGSEARAGVISPMELDYRSDEDLSFIDIYDDADPYKSVVVKRKQSLWRGCGVLLGVFAAMFVVVYGLSEVLDTDFGLPLLFKEGSNMADLMYIAKNYKSDILTLGNSGGSSVQPDPGTSQPTIEPTTPAPTTSSQSPTLSPSLNPTPVPTRQPTRAPTTVPTSLPTVRPSAVPSRVPSRSPTARPSHTPTMMPSAQPSRLPTHFPTTSSAPTRTPTLVPTPFPTVVPSPVPTPVPLAFTLSPTSTPTVTPSRTPSSSPSCTPSATPTAVPTTPPTSEPSSAPSSEPSSDPTSEPTNSPTGEPSSSPSAVPSNCPTSLPSSQPSGTPSASSGAHTRAPSALADLASVGNTAYDVYACYGIDIEQENIDTTPTAKVNAESFARYAEHGMMADLRALCDYLESKKIYMEVAMRDSECIYNELMAVSSDDIDVFERIGLWVSRKKERFFQVGVEETGGGVVSGNFGEDLDLWLTFICHPISCKADVSSFFSQPDHALMMISRWDNAVYDEGSAAASNQGVSTLTGSDAWLFPLLSNRIVSSIYVSSLISFAGGLFLIGLATRNVKLSLLIGIGMLFVMILSLLLHAIFFSPVIDLIDIIVLISFVGIIIDYPTHMAFHYEQDLRLRSRAGVAQEHDGDFGCEAAQEEEERFHRKSFGYMRLALVGPAVTTIFSALPLMFAEFSILSKAGEYVVIMCLCTYVYVAFVMPTLLRLIGELVFIPCRYTVKDSLHFAT